MSQAMKNWHGCTKPLMEMTVTKSCSYISRSWILKAMHFFNILKSSGITMMTFGTMLDRSVSTSSTTWWKASVTLQNCRKCTPTTALGPLRSPCCPTPESKIAILWQYLVTVVSRVWRTTIRSLPLYNYNTAVKFFQEVWQPKALILLAPPLTPALDRDDSGNNIKQLSWLALQQLHDTTSTYPHQLWLRFQQRTLTWLSMFCNLNVFKYLYHKSMFEIFFGVDSENMFRNLTMPS